MNSYLKEHLQLKADLYRLEGAHMQVTKNCINKCIAGRTDTEYKQDNKDNIKQNNKYYKEKNKNKIYAKITCKICGVEHTYNHTARHLKSKYHITALNAKKITQTEPEEEDIIENILS